MNYPIWHPFTQMKTAGIPEKVVRAQGNYIYLESGEKLLDAISSWWVNPFGHGRREIADAIHQQILELDHVIFAGFRHDPAEQLSNRLLRLGGSGFSKAFFSDNGSTSVEVGLKMGIQSLVQQGKGKKIRILSLQDGYHGDTFGSMSAGRHSTFFTPFEDFLFETGAIPLPGTPGWEEALEQHLQQEGTSILLYEPLVLGAGGMQMYSPENLERMLQLCKQYGAITIADEVMTGFGRTGTMFASHQATTQPDIMCVSKCLTGGVMPMGITLASEAIFKAFWTDSKAEAFLHGHSYTGNPVGCAAALASLNLYETLDWEASVTMAAKHFSAFASRLEQLDVVDNVRWRGMIFAVELKAAEGGYFAKQSISLTEEARKSGILLRPLGNVWYCLTPFTIEEGELIQVLEVIEGLAKRL